MKIGITERGDGFIHFNEWISKIDTVDGAIIISKNVSGLLSKIEILKKYKLIIHCTITGLSGTAFEPGVNDWKKELIAYKQLKKEFGSQKVVLRIDPIFPIGEMFNKSLEILKNSQSNNDRVRISFLDLYNKIYYRNKTIFRYLKPFYGNNIHLPLELRKTALKRLNENRQTSVEICGEPGLPSIGCISQKDLDILKIPYNINDIRVLKKQRSTCNCIAVKTELLSSRTQCDHQCVYCYWKNRNLARR